MKVWRSAVMAAMLTGVAASAHAQASAIPSAAPPASADADAHGRQVLDQMVTALGGDAWRNRRNWRATGNFGNFYKGTPNDVALKFEELHQTEPYATRFIVITHMGSNIGELLGVPVGKDHGDVVELMTAGTTYEITYKGKRELPKELVTEQLRLQAHSMDAVLGWLKQPGT